MYQRYCGRKSGVDTLKLNHDILLKP